MADLLGVAPAAYTPRQMGYDLQRLGRKGLIQRVEGKLCYTLTSHGRRVALFLTKL
jgi:Mn-dependent DtxR family transcriptional regulator